MIYSSPLTAFFGLPIFGVEFSLLRETQWLWSMGIYAIQSLPSGKSPRGWHETGIESTLTYQPLAYLHLSLIGALALESGPDALLESKPWEFQKVRLGGSITWTPLDWLFVQTRGQNATFYYSGERLDTEAVLTEAMLGLAIGHWRLAGGLTYGRSHIFEEEDAIRPNFDLWVRW